MKIVGFFLVFISLVSQSWAQQSRIEPTVFDKSDGFELSRVASVVADDDGFLWLGGENLYIRDILGTNKKLALQRFNGTNFDNIIIPEKEGKVTSVKSLFKRTDGKFYVSIVVEMKTQIILFDPITTKFTFFKNPGDKSVGSSISAIFQHKNKNYVLTKNGEKITQYELKDDLSFASVYSFNYSETIVSIGDARLVMTDQYCIISDNNMPMHVFNWQGKLIRKYAPSDYGLTNVTSNSRTYMDECFIRNNTCYFFLLENPQLYTLDLSNLKVNPVQDVSMESDNLYVLQQDNKTIIVNRLEDNLSFYQVKNTTSPQIKLDTLFSNSEFGQLSVNRAFSRNLSKELWIVTDDQHLLHYSIEKKPINRTLTNQSIRALLPYSPHEILVATDFSGWSILNYKSNTTQPYTSRYNNEEYSAGSSRGFIKIDNNIWSTNYAHLVKVNLDTKKVFQSKNYPITCIAKKSKTQIVCGTGGYELVLYDIPSDEHRTLLKTDSLDIIDIKVYDDWAVAGTNKGLLIYQFSTKKHQFIQKDETLIDEYILSVSNISTGVFALGTKFGKLFTFDVRSKKMELVYEDELNAGIANMLIDDNKRWWLSTFNGLVCFDPKTKMKQRYSTSNGLSNNEANRYSSLKIGKTLFFGSYKGLNYFSTDRLKPETDGAKLVLMMSEIFDTEKNAFQSTLNRRILNEQSEFYLPAVQRSIKMRFAVQKGKVDGKYTINYRLNKDRWSTLDNKNALNFSNLAPGRYSLEVKLIDFSGKPIGRTIKYTLNIKRFFYETVWFYVLIALIGSSVFTWYFIQLRKQAKMREKFSEDLIHLQESERARISKELHDSVGQQLTLLKRTAQNRDQLEISNLANNTLEEVRAISKNLHPPLLTELGLTESIRALIHSFDEETKLFFTVDLINIDSHFDQTGALHIYRFVQEGLSNLLKHSQAKTAYIEISMDQNKQINVMIEDDGIGIKSGAKSFSLGLTTMQERIRILNGNFIIEKPKKGTRLIAKIPIS